MAGSRQRTRSRNTKAKTCTKPNPWLAYLRQHSGKGLSRLQLVHGYRKLKQVPVRKTPREKSKAKEGVDKSVRQILLRELRRYKRDNSNRLGIFKELGSMLLRENRFPRLRTESEQIYMGRSSVGGDGGICGAVAGSMFHSSGQWTSISSGGETLLDRMTGLYKGFLASGGQSPLNYEFVKWMAKDLKGLNKALFPLVDIIMCKKTSPHVQKRFWDIGSCRASMYMVTKPRKNPKCATALFLQQEGTKYVLPLTPTSNDKNEHFLLPKSEIPGHLYA